MGVNLIKLIVFLFISLSFQIQAQQNFHRVYLFNDTTAIFNDLYVTDSCYYYTCTSGKGNQRHYFNFGKLSLTGDEQVLLLDEDVNSFQNVMSSMVDMDTNFRGNFITSFTNSSSLGIVPRIKEFQADGLMVFDTTYNQYWTNDSLSFFSKNRQLISNSDSSYLLFTYKVDLTTDDNTTWFNGSEGTLLTKVKYDGQILWQKEFKYLPVGLYKPQWMVLNFLKYSSSSYLLIINEVKHNAPSNAQMDWSKIHIFEVDENGNQLNHKVFQDGQYCWGSYGAVVLEDGGILLTYYESILGGTPPNNDYFITRPVVARLSSSFNLVWKQTLRELHSEIGTYDNMFDLKLFNDSLFVGAFHYYDKLFDGPGYYAALRIGQYNLDGDNKWNREYNYFPTDNLNDPQYGIYDLELTPDGGYIMSGEAFIYDSLVENAPCQYGYVLKTNCLGFLGDPISEYSYTTNFGSAECVNYSIQAGSYTWIFGDGDTLITTEYVDTVTHVYSENGNYTVQLIAHGCNGMNDTISKTVNVSGISSGYVGDGTLLTIYPNPLSSGESLAFYVGSITEENVTVEIFNSIGQVVFKGKIKAANTTYIVPLNLSSGEYFVSLRDGNKDLEVEKLIVK